MSFYIFDLGPLSARLQEYADLDGRVPEAGDKWTDFRWPQVRAKAFADKDAGEKVWQEFLKRAIAATSVAVSALDELKWRKR